MTMTPAGTAHPPTQLIILAAATLYRAAWPALLSQQPDIVVVGTINDISDISPLLQPEMNEEIVTKVFIETITLSQE
jgi:hypothetical protein